MINTISSHTGEKREGERGKDYHLKGIKIWEELNSDTHLPCCCSPRSKSYPRVLVYPVNPVCNCKKSPKFMKHVAVVNIVE